MCPIFKVDGFCIKEDCRFYNETCIYQELKDKRKAEYLKKKRERENVLCENSRD